MAVKAKAAAPPATKPRFCTSKIRKIAEVEVCNVKLKNHPLGGDICPNKENHLYPLLTGFCHSGWHEGVKAVTASGAPAPTCKFYINCPCECHARLNRMYQISGQERILVDNSDWKPESISLPAHVTSIVTVPSVAPTTDAPPAREEPAAAVLPAPIARSFEPTPTGRTARGELESWVKVETDAWAADVIASAEHPEIVVRNCTPRFVAEEIARSKGIKAPSEGAVNAVFMRWEKIGFARIERKPTRFTGYTPDGIRLGLEAMKSRAKKTAP